MYPEMAEKLPYLDGGPMTQRFCSLIILAPAAPRAFKLHLSRGAIAVLILACVLSFLALSFLGYTFPQVNDLHRTRLKAENDALKMEALEATAGIKMLDAKLAELESASKRLEEFVAQ